MTTDIPLRVFIGTEPKTLIPCKVLEFSIQRRTGRPLQFTRLEGPDWVVPGDLPCGTGFSLRRWLIPHRLNYQGRALYLDADMLCLGDLGEVWDMPERFPTAGASAWMTWQPDRGKRDVVPQSSLMTIDCALAEGQKGWHPDWMYDYLRAHEDRFFYHAFMHGSWMLPRPGPIPTAWNRFERYDPQTKLIHYTNEATQPWYDPSRAHANLWRDELKAAIRAGYVTRADFEEARGRWGKKTGDGRRYQGLHPDYDDLRKALKG